MFKMVMLTYNEAIDAEVMEVLQNCGLENYTKVMGVFGKGKTSGAHLGNDIWPGRNNILYIACEEGRVKQTLSCIQELHKEVGKEGIKAFVFPLEEVSP